MKMAGGYRSLRKGSHGMKPNFVLPAISIVFDPTIDDKGRLAAESTGKYAG